MILIKCLECWKDIRNSRIICLLCILIVVTCLCGGAIAQAIEVPAGQYLVGEDIPEGAYTVTNNGSIYNDVDVYMNTEDAKTKIYGDIHICLSDYESIGKLTLAVGNVVNLDHSVTFESYKGLGFSLDSKEEGQKKSIEKEENNSDQEVPSNLLERIGLYSKEEGQKKSTEKEENNSDQEVPSNLLERIENLEERVGYLESILQSDNRTAESTPTFKPTATPTAKPTIKPTQKPTAKPTPEPMDSAEKEKYIKPAMNEILKQVRNSGLNRINGIKLRSDKVYLYVENNEGVIYIKYSISQAQLNVNYNLSALVFVTHSGNDYSVTASYSADSPEMEKMLKQYEPYFEDVSVLALLL